VVDRCSLLRNARAVLDTQFAQIEAALRQSLSGASLNDALARLAQVRTATNAAIDAQLAGCPPGTV
jgi:hypothetical protein